MLSTRTAVPCTGRTAFGAVRPGVCRPARASTVARVGNVNEASFDAEVLQVGSLMKMEARRSWGVDGTHVRG